jgi:L-lactate permease
MHRVAFLQNIISFGRPISERAGVIQAIGFRKSNKCCYAVYLGGRRSADVSFGQPIGTPVDAFLLAFEYPISILWPNK